MPDNVISVVGGGWSVTQIDLKRIPGTIIAINDAAIHLPRVDIIVSMDRKWTEFRFAKLREMMKPAHIRRAALLNITDRWPWLNVFECDYRTPILSDRRGVLNGTNSGQCGLNLAYQERPQQILLFGFDMKRGPNGEPYWYPTYPWNPVGATKDGKYRDWSREFVRVKRQLDAAQIDIAVVGDSAIDCFRRIPSSEFGKVPA